MENTNSTSDRFCINCKHHKSLQPYKETSIETKYDADVCTLKVLKRSPVTGSIKYMRAEDVRSEIPLREFKFALWGLDRDYANEILNEVNKTQCGPQGNLYEPKSGS